MQQPSLSPRSRLPTFQSLCQAGPPRCPAQDWVRNSQRPATSSSLSRWPHHRSLSRAPHHSQPSPPATCQNSQAFPLPTPLGKGRGTYMGMFRFRVSCWGADANGSPPLRPCLPHSHMRASPPASTLPWSPVPPNLCVLDRSVGSKCLSHHLPLRPSETHG